MVMIPINAMMASMKLETLEMVRAMSGIFRWRTLQLRSTWIHKEWTAE
jgi:hypothetical protein